MSSGYSMDGSEEEEDYFDDFEDDSVEDSKTPIINNKSLETKERKNQKESLWKNRKKSKKIHRWTDEIQGKKLLF